MSLDIAGALMSVKPLDLSCVPDGFLRDYVNLYEPLTEAHPQLHLAAALIAVSTVLGKKVYMPFGASAIHPNLFILGLGESGMARKSTTLNPVVKMLYRFDESLIMGDVMSHEAFFKSLRENPNKFGCWHEFRSLIENAEKNYGKGLIAELTKLYDCPPFIKVNLLNVKKNENPIIKDPYVAVICLTTIDWFKVSQADISGGFLGRFLPIASPPGKSRSISVPPPVDEGLENVLFNLLSDISKLEGRISLATDALELVKGLYAESEEEFKTIKNRDIYSSFWSRLQTNLLKLSIVLSLTKSSPSFVIQADTILKANHIMSHAKESYKFMMENANLTPEMAKERKVMRIIEEAGKAGIRHSDALKRSHETAKPFEYIIKSLIEKEEVEQHQLASKTKTATFYVLKKFAKGCEVSGEESPAEGARHE